MAAKIIGALIFAAILAGVFFPVFNKIASQPGISQKIASVLTCLLITIIVIIPLGFVIVSLSKEVVGLYQLIVKGLEQEQINDFFFGQGLGASALKKVNDLFEVQIELSSLKLKLLDSAKGASGFLLKSLNSILGNIFSFLLNIALMMVTIFSLFIEGPALKKYIFSLSPLENEHEQNILDKFNQMNYVTIVCNTIGGIIQGGLCGLIIWMAGIHSAFLWTVTMSVLAFIPLVGVSIITVPCSVVLILTGSKAAGIFVLISTSLISFAVENWFKPKFIGQRIQINSTLVLLTIVGGMGVFGMAGIFYGPLIAIIFLTVMGIYERNYKIS